jgi:hypothetical protein
VGPRAGLDTEARGKILNSRQEPCFIREVRSSDQSFCKCILIVAMLSKERKYEDENRDRMGRIVCICREK